MSSRNIVFSALLLSCYGPTSSPETASDSDSASPSDSEDSTVVVDSDNAVPSGERIYLGTGEYDPNQSWHAILRFESTENFNFPALEDGATPEGVVPVKACEDSAGVPQNFIHGFFVDEDADEMYFAAIFTPYGGYKGQPTDLTDAGAIGVFAGASAMDGSQVLTRRLYGDQTGLSQPHGVWVDRGRNVMYVPNTFGENILVWDNADTVDGNVPPDRVIDYPDLQKPVFIYIDEPADRMFVATMGMNPAVQVIENASNAEGNVVPSLRITGQDTRLQLGNQTTHNLWYDDLTETLIVGHHTHEVLFFDLSDVDWETSGQVENVAPAGVLSIANESNLSDSADWSAYGIWFDPEDGGLFVSAGHTIGGGGPEAGAQSGHAVKIYANVRDYFGSGPTPTYVEPDRILRWTNRAEYFPPQPVWVTKPE